MFLARNKDWTMNGGEMADVAGGTMSADTHARFGMMKMLQSTYCTSSLVHPILDHLQSLPWQNIQL